MPLSAEINLKIWLQRLILQRFIITTVLLGSSVYIYVSGESNIFGLGSRILWLIIIVSYIASFIYYLIRNKLSHSGLEALATFQILIETVFASGLVYITGGGASFFTPLYCVIICYSACLLGRSFGYFASGLATLSFSAIAILELYDVIPHALPLDRGPEDVVAVTTLVAICLNMLLFGVVALIIGYLVEGVDAAERRRVVDKKKIDDLTGLNQIILDSVSSGILTVDSNNKLISINKAGERIFSKKGSNVIGLNIDEVIPGISERLESLSSKHQSYESSMPVSETWLHEFEASDGKVLFLNVSASRILSGGCVIAFQDSTEMRRLEQQMRQSESLAAVGRVSAAIAHEIRNPLASISASIEMLQADSASGESKELMSIALRETQRLNNIITEFLEYARPRAPKIEECDISHVVKEVVGLVKQKEKNVEIELDVKKGISAFVDRDQLVQVLWNIFQNACDAAEGATKIRVSVRKESEKRLVLEVRDWGPGIPKDVQARIFEPFFTTKPSGSGLGLATVNKIITSHGGNIDLVPVEGRGACFRIQFDDPEVEQTASI